MRNLQVVKVNIKGMDGFQIQGLDLACSDSHWEPIAHAAIFRDEKRAEAIGHQTARGVEPGDTAHLVVDVPGRAAGRVTRDGLHVTKRRDPPDQVRAGVGNVEVAVTITRNARRGVERCCRVGAIRATGGESGGEPAGEMVGSPSRVGPLQPHDAVVGRVVKRRACGQPDE